MRSYTRHPKKEIRRRPAPPGLREPIAAAIFDAILDHADRATVEARIRAVAVDETEAAIGISRYDRAVQSVCRGVTL